MNTRKLIRGKVMTKDEIQSQLDEHEKLAAHQLETLKNEAIKANANKPKNCQGFIDSSSGYYDAFTEKFKEIKPKRLIKKGFTLADPLTKKVALYDVLLHKGTIYLREVAI